MISIVGRLSGVRRLYETLQLPRQQKNLPTDHPDELGSVRHTTLETVREMIQKKKERL